MNVFPDHSAFRGYKPEINAFLPSAEVIADLVEPLCTVSEFGMIEYTNFATARYFKWR